jgi:hypothetical protein
MLSDAGTVSPPAFAAHVVRNGRRIAGFTGKSLAPAQHVVFDVGIKRRIDLEVHAGGPVSVLVRSNEGELMAGPMMVGPDNRSVTLRW